MSRPPSRLRPAARLPRSPRQRHRHQRRAGLRSGERRPRRPQHQRQAPPLPAPAQPTAGPGRAARATAAQKPGPSPSAAAPPPARRRAGPRRADRDRPRWRPGLPPIAGGALAATAGGCRCGSPARPSRPDAAAPTRAQGRSQRRPHSQPRCRSRHAPSGASCPPPANELRTTPATPMTRLRPGSGRPAGPTPRRLPGPIRGQHACPEAQARRPGTALGQGRRTAAARHHFPSPWVRLPSSPRLMCRAGAAAAESGRCGPAAGRATPILYLHWCRSYSAPPAIGRNRSGRHHRLEPSRLTCIAQVVRNGPVAPGLPDLGMPESADRKCGRGLASQPRALHLTLMWPPRAVRAAG